MAETRGKGEGSVYKRSDGKWVGSIECGRNRQGKRQRRRVVRSTRAACIKALDKLRQGAAKGATPDGTRRLSDYLDWWLTNEKAGRIKDSTVTSYRGTCDRDIVPHLGGLRLGDLTSEHVATWLRTLEGFGLKAASVKRARRVLGCAMRHAASRGWVQGNPVSVVRGMPESSGGKLDDTLTATDANKVLRTATGDRWYTLAYVALHLGLRRGELVGLRWSDVDFDAEELSVRQTLHERQWRHGCDDPAACAAEHHTTRCRKACRRHAFRCPQRHGGGLAVDTPKTQRSARTVPLVAGTEPPRV